MINTKMIQNQEQDTTENVENEKKPNEQAGFHFSSSLKIVDPDSGQVLLQKRAD